MRWPVLSVPVGASRCFQDKFEILSHRRFSLRRVRVLVHQTSNDTTHRRAGDQPAQIASIRGRNGDGLTYPRSNHLVKISSTTRTNSREDRSNGPRQALEALRSLLTFAPPLNANHQGLVC